MKNTIKIVGFSVFLLLSSCENLDVPITTQLTPNVFPQTPTQYIQTAGSVYVAFRDEFSLGYWFAQSLSTDEAILPARGGNYYDSGVYQQMHYHTWTADSQWPSRLWNWSARIIGISNQTIATLTLAMPEGAEKDTMLAELRTMRAIAYFIMMDNFGGVPIYTDPKDFAPRKQSTRVEVFDFIEKELKAALPNLSIKSDVSTYGRPNMQTANAMLAKLYLNAEVYTGTSRYDDCIAACDAVISSGLYSIESASTYLKMFYPDNGPQMKEFIFAVPYNGVSSLLSAPFGGGIMSHSRYDLPRAARKITDNMGKTIWSLNFNPSGPESTLPEFYAYFDDDKDVRNSQWLIGALYNGFKEGQPIPLKDKDVSVIITPDIVLKDVDKFDTGDTPAGWNMGYRNIKFYPDALATDRNQNNDVPYLRYSDVILMKAEAILRGGSPTLGHTALSLVNMVRGNRSTSPVWTSVDLEALYKERSREFAYEAWHRNDMIRFDKFEGNWGFKTNTETYRRIFPIPTNARVLNPALQQNEGY